MWCFVELGGGQSPLVEEPEICFTKAPSPVLASLRGRASFCARLQSRPLSHTAFTWTVAGRSVSSADDRITVSSLSLIVDDIYVETQKNVFHKCFSFWIKFYLGVFTELLTLEESNT